MKHSAGKSLVFAAAMVLAIFSATLGEGPRGADSPRGPQKAEQDTAPAPRPKFEPRMIDRPDRPAITNPPVIAARDVSGQVTDNELVLGVVVNGEARAYPINMLTGPRREIVNDTLGGRAIAATW